MDKLKQTIDFGKASIKVIGADRTYSESKTTTRSTGSLGSTGSTTIRRWEAVTVTLQQDEEGICSVSIVNSGDEAFQLQRVCIEWTAEQFTPRLDSRDYIQLYHSRDFSKLSGVRPVHRPNDWSDPADASGMVTVLSKRQDGTALLIGALPPYGDCFADFPLLHDKPHRDGSFGFGIHLQSPRRLTPGQEDTLAHLVALEGADGTELLERYGELIRRRLSSMIRVRPRITGWNTWDYYAGAVRQSDITDNAAAARTQFGDALRYFVVDEGYECQWGVWESGWKFPDGLDGLCASIRENGYEPGIWTAPLMVNVYTPLYRQHPDWFVGDGQGNPYLTQMGYGTMAQLDMTRPGAAAHIRDVYTRLRANGFTYFKCDFTQMLLGASSFASGDLSHAGMLRKLFLTIREAIGDDAYLLACGAPYEAAAGIADAHRTTGDIHNYWSHIRQNIRSMFARWWMQGTLGNTDPDFAIVRCGDTTDDTLLNRRQKLQPWRAGGNWGTGREMNLEEAKTLLLACLVTGGDLVLGDALGKLNAEGTALLRRIMDIPVSRGQPLNLFRPDGDDLPIVVADSGGGKLIALFNLSDDYLAQSVPETVFPRSGTGVEIWSGGEEALPSGGVVPLAPRSAKAWLVRQGV
ncbi:glycoside hydrolase family 36 protein [Paenibacillus oceani]|uniref:Alpha-galactosidase n=1 Tax=Paenibacillus oceani TaxID=2772510 RepID=A0A927C7R3_9BACL|nr:glycoside hydrolase family 36 protein [Paenibacillus oceani]MBD2862404.1 alpha-galactosidase [Paenibacillus oceani]